MGPNFFFLILAELGLYCSMRAFLQLRTRRASPLLHGLSLVSESGDYSLVAVCGLLIAVASLNVEYGL